MLQNRVWERSSTKVVVGYGSLPRTNQQAATLAYAASGPFPGPRCPWVKRNQGQGSIFIPQRKMKRETYGVAAPVYSLGPDGPQQGERMEVWKTYSG